MSTIWYPSSIPIVNQFAFIVATPSDRWAQYELRRSSPSRALTAQPGEAASRSAVEELGTEANRSESPRLWPRALEALTVL
jgi:hypothetical protein